MRGIPNKPKTLMMVFESPAQMHAAIYHMFDGKTMDKNGVQLTSWDLKLDGNDYIITLSCYSDKTSTASYDHILLFGIEHHTRPAHEINQYIRRNTDGRQNQMIKYSPGADSQLVLVPYNSTTLIPCSGAMVTSGEYKKIILDLISHLHRPTPNVLSVGPTMK